MDTFYWALKEITSTKLFLDLTLQRHIVPVLQNAKWPRCSLKVFHMVVYKSKTL